MNADYVRKIPVDNPIKGQLPYDCLTPFMRPFSYTGLDYFGPINVTIGRRHEKRWVALFTCMTTRAVHLELAADLSSDSCILCIKNFINLRGVPVKIRSDNGTNFVGADKTIYNLTKNLRMKRLVTNYPEKASFGSTTVHLIPKPVDAGNVWCAV